MPSFAWLCLGPVIRVCWGMWIRPHENLTVWSIRNDLFGPGRFADHSHARVRGVNDMIRTHHHAPVGPARPVVHAHVKKIEKTLSLSPADCHPCGRGVQPGGDSYSPGSTVGTTPLAPLSDPASKGATPPGELGITQDFAHSQRIPAVGGLLDILA